MHGRDVGLFDRFAPLYELLMPPAKGSVLEDALSRATRDVEVILDVGGGPGRASLATGVPRRIVVDAAHGMLRRAVKNDLEAVTGDATRLPIGDEGVDGIVIVDALHHMLDADAVIDEAARALEPGGVLVIREFDPGTLRGKGLVLAERVVGFKSTFYESDKLLDRMESSGLEAFLTESGFGYTVVGRKPNPD